MKYLHNAKKPLNYSIAVYCKEDYMELYESNKQVTNTVNILDS